MLHCHRCRVTASFLLTTLVLSALSSATAAEAPKTPPRDYEAIIHSDGPGRLVAVPSAQAG